jgi:regulator of replication initiation timing
MLQVGIKLLQKRIQELTQDNPDPVLRENNAKELVRLFDGVFENVKELKSEYVRISLENKNLKEVLSKSRSSSANDHRPL